MGTSIYYSFNKWCISYVYIYIYEITAEGVSPPLWFPTLLPNQFNTQDVWEEIQRPCSQHQLLVPMAGRVRRWLNPYHTRDSVPGLFIPTWHDRRLPLLSEQPYAEGQSLLQISVRSLDFHIYPSVPEDEAEAEEADALHLMQRSSSRTPRRDTQDSVSTESIVTAHTFLPSRSHRFLTLDRSRLSYVAQIQESWQFPPHTTLVDLHEVLYPPSDLEGSSDVVFLLETSTCRTRQAVPNDQLVLVDIVLAGAGDTGDQSHTRRVLWSRKFATRDTTLHLLSSHTFCSSSQVHCILTLNRVVWAEEDSAIREIRHGDAISLWIRKPRTMSLSEVRITLAEHESADSQRYLFCASPSSSSTPSPFSEATPRASPSSPDAPSDAYGFDVTPVPWTHVSDRWCSPQDEHADPGTEQIGSARPLSLQDHIYVNTDGCYWQQVLGKVDSNDNQVSQLRQALVKLRKWPDTAFCNCWEDIPDAHPYVSLIRSLQPELQHPEAFHIFTDGSFHKSTGIGAWSFSIVLQLRELSFFRWGFTGGRIDSCGSAVEAEA